MAINNRPDIHEQVICANVFIRKDDTYLVLRRSPLKTYAPGVIHPVGGKVNIGENPYQAAMREVCEETGVTLDNVRLEAVVQEIQPVKGEPYNWFIFHFSADYASGNIIATDEGELEWLTADEIRRETLFPSVEKIISHVLNRERGTVFATFEYDSQKRNVIKQTINFCVLS